MVLNSFLMLFWPKKVFVTPWGILTPQMLRNPLCPWFKKFLDFFIIKFLQLWVRPSPFLCFYSFGPPPRDLSIARLLLFNVCILSFHPGNQHGFVRYAIRRLTTINFLWTVYLSTSTRDVRLMMKSFSRKMDRGGLCLKNKVAGCSGCESVLRKPFVWF